MESALEEIEFLALSANRVEVLRLLAAEPRSRSGLAAATGASQATLGRILRDFEDRSWIRRVDSAYEATATGRLVADGFTDLLEIVETERDLRGIVQHLPAEAMGFDLRRLSDAEITTPTETRPNAPIKRLLDLHRQADEVRAFSHALNEQSLAVLREETADGGQTFRGVLSEHAVDALTADPELREQLRSLLSTPHATLRMYEGEIPIAVTEADGVVHFLLRDDSGVLRAAIETEDDAVRSWARAEFDRYWEAATPLEADDLRT